MLTTSFQSQTVPMPVCRYEVLSGGPDGEPVKYARVGDQVYHKWTCDTDTVNMFCMVVHSCKVDDGAGDQITLVNELGCGLDKHLLGKIEYISDLMAGKEAHVFKYADKADLFFDCQITITVKVPGFPCPRPGCADPVNFRGKRFIETSTKSLVSTNSYADSSTEDNKPGINSHAIRSDVQSINSENLSANQKDEIENPDTEFSIVDVESDVLKIVDQKFIKKKLIDNSYYQSLIDSFTIAPNSTFVNQDDDRVCMTVAAMTLYTGFRDYQ